MVDPSDVEGLRAAWRALASGREGEGWQTIPITSCAPCTLFAGRRVPGGEEAVLIGFRSINKVPAFYLPQGRGFDVLRLQTDPTGGDRLILALARRTGGSLELFAMMAEDLLVLLHGCAASGEDQVLQRFLARIRAWQDFMDRHREDMLSAEAEQGLFGELVLLEQMIEAGVAGGNVLDAWQGPLDGLQDFMLGGGGIEVKTTLSTSGFPATVSSLEQLDESMRQPLFVAAIRLAQDPSGRTLPEMADVIKARLDGDQAALETFEIRLIQAGLLRTVTERYVSRYLHASIAILAVQGNFPRLTRATVPTAIRRARYEIDLHFASAEEVDLVRALESLGVA